MNQLFTESWVQDDEELVQPAPARESVNCFLDDAEIFTPAEYSQFQPSSEHQLNVLHESVREDLSYHFMNPIQKWRAKRRFPWKLCLQVIKIIFVTYQVTLFGLRSHGYVQQHRDVTMALGHIFLLDWVPDQVVYPPSTGSYAVYTKPEFFNSIDYAVKQYTTVSTLAIASFSYDSNDGTIQPFRLCLTHYKQGDIYPFNATVTIDSALRETCIKIPALYPSGDPRWKSFSMADFLTTSNITLKFSTLVKVKLIFHMKTVLPKSVSKLDVPECYRLKIVILYDNQNHDGQMKVSLTIYPEKLDCKFNILYRDVSENRSYVFRQMLNGVVITLCISSVILCTRSLFKGNKLRCKMSEFFRIQFQKVMTCSEHLDFVDFWYVLMIFSDIFIVSGSIIKIRIEEHHHSDTLYTECTFFLGIGNLLVWVGLLRYLSFFKKYNMLILTLKCAVPNVLRFLMCAVLLFAGFCFCGWIVLGPYHVKFQSLSRTSECLFAVMNGDDMFSTFVLLGVDDPLIWWFCRIYLYLFLVLFVYVVISLFISVIMDTFETIKHLYVHGSPPKSTIELFLSASLPRPSTPPLPINQSEDESHSLVVLKAFFTKLLERLPYSQ